MKVVDAGVVVDVLIGHLDPMQLGEDVLVAPHLLDSEVLQVLRRLVRSDALSVAEGEIAVAALGRLVISRFPALGLHARIWELRQNLTAYDATYVALAERVGAPLLTTDARLAAAPGATCRIELVH
ncbi:type II toxin-antitoxin system VapC family toxin [Agrococcus baldri]|uniref:Ribonuclease VapC n=1 Tax=Agrococcus baldri TaxID=153730 RepID=A0AA87UWK9_9MICO|nr:type II toxin-antitoxin system VapC family toxin [Agrococcus baldri]GEK79562.1 ribonuclease VapC9 [Agrococcus baldri]